MKGKALTSAGWYEAGLLQGDLKVLRAAEWLRSTFRLSGQSSAIGCEAFDMIGFGSRSTELLFRNFPSKPSQKRVNLQQPENRVFTHAVSRRLVSLP